ncbi:hypothetical protein AAG570_007270 [Ranatra chinensis]|uniref:Uncharacterized protein n=1 Tax=Ranatra chinensis TaxID=642074 RepID=A0ABD0XVE0_9HEMI
MAWSEWGFSSRIAFASMDGSRQKTLVERGVVWPTGLAVDQPTGRLYWCDSKTRTIDSVSLISGSPERTRAHVYIGKMTSYIIVNKLFIFKIRGVDIPAELNDRIYSLTSHNPGGVRIIED